MHLGSFDKYCRFCQRPFCKELLGIALTVAAVVSMYADPTAMRADDKTGETWVYAVCIACSISSALWILINNELLKTLPISANLLILSVLIYLYTIVFCFTLVDDYSYFSNSMEAGGIGLFQSEQAVPMFCMFGPL